MTRAKQDLLLIALLVAPAFVLASYFDAFEMLVDWTRGHEYNEMDELITISLLLWMAFGIFAWRRWREANTELCHREQAEQALLKAHQELEQKVELRTRDLSRLNAQLAQEVGERAQVEAQIRQLLADNRRLHNQTMSMLENHKRELAQELHDEFGQCLTAIQIDARIIHDQTGVSPDRVRASADSIVAVTRRMYDAMQSLVKQLRPEALDELGLADAIRDTVDGWRARVPQISYCLQIGDPLEEVSDEVAIHTYRVLQECLNNIGKHANASQVEVTLDLETDAAGSCLLLQVVDDGCGFDPHRIHSGLGLVGIRERAESLRGHAEIDSQPGNGTRVRFRTPLNVGEAVA